MWVSIRFVTSPSDPEAHLAKNFAAPIETMKKVK